MISAVPKAALSVVHLFASVCLVLAGGSVGNAGDVRAGRTKAMMCQACHGLDGLSKTPQTHQTSPRKSNHTSSYSCKRTNPVSEKNDAMSVVAPSLSDTDIEDLAAYFSAIEINVVKMPGG